MFRLVETKPESRDGITWYNVLIPENYTLRKFIREVLKQYKDSWGDINIEKDGQQIDSYSYAYGKIKSIFKKLPKDKQILSVKAYGGYSYMSFIVSVLN